MHVSFPNNKKRKFFAEDHPETTDPKYVRIQQVGMIYEGCFGIYFMDGALEDPIIVPYLIVEACTLLERVCPGGHNKNHGLSHKNIAAACLYLAIQLHSESMGPFKIRSFVEIFRIQDKTITNKNLRAAQSWVLKELDFSLWCGPEQQKQGKIPFLEGDKDLNERTLIEVGFLAEQSLYDVSMAQGTFQNTKDFRKFLDNHEHYKVYRQRLRDFCDDPQKFRETYFKWSLPRKK
jgi:hypothetical protein